MTLNLSVTVAIAWRLWWMGRQLASLAGTRANRNTSINVVIESGVISAVGYTIVFALYASNSPVLWAGLDAAPQLAVCVHPLPSGFPSRTESLRFGRL